MNTGRTVFSQLIEFLPHQQFQKCVARYGGARYLKNLSCWDQYLAMAFAQLTYRESRRDIEACLGSIGSKLYHMGFRGKVARSTLADANESRDWRIYADFAQVLIAIARPLYALDPIGVDLDQSLYALDSTTIDLCLALFPWAKFRKHKAAVKMHTLLSARQRLPHLDPFEKQFYGPSRLVDLSKGEEEEAFEIHVRAVHDVERTGLRHDLVQDIYVVHSFGFWSWLS